MHCMLIRLLWMIHHSAPARLTGCYAAFVTAGIVGAVGSFASMLGNDDVVCCVCFILREKLSLT